MRKSWVKSKPRSLFYSFFSVRLCAVTWTSCKGKKLLKHLTTKRDESGKPVSDKC